MAVRSSQRRLDVTPCLAQAAVQTMLWNAILITIGRIMGLNVAIPGSCLMANAAPAITQFRNRPGRISRGFRPGHRWMVEGRRASARSFTDSASLVIEIKVMSWLHRPSNPISLSLPINPTDNNCKTNQFYRLIKTWLARRKTMAPAYDQSRDRRHRHQCWIYPSGFEAKQDTARRY